MVERRNISMVRNLSRLLVQLVITHIKVYVFLRIDLNWNTILSTELKLVYYVAIGKISSVMSERPVVAFVNAFSRLTLI